MIFFLFWIFHVISDVLFLLSFDKSAILLLSFDLIWSCSSPSWKPLPQHKPKCSSSKLKLAHFSRGMANSKLQLLRIWILTKETYYKWKLLGRDGYRDESTWFDPPQFVMCDSYELDSAYMGRTHIDPYSIWVNTGWPVPYIWAGSDSSRNKSRDESGRKKFSPTPSFFSPKLL